MGPVEALSSVLRQYATSRGRARRAEYWWWSLAMVVLFFGAALLGVGLQEVAGGEGSAGGDTVATVSGLVLFVALLGLVVPSVAVSVRRLHDAGMSGWLYLINLVPVGGIAFVVLMVLPSVGPNRWGPPPASGPLPGYGPGYGPGGVVDGRMSGPQRWDDGRRP